MSVVYRVILKRGALLISIAIQPLPDPLESLPDRPGNFPAVGIKFPAQQCREIVSYPLAIRLDYPRAGSKAEVKKAIFPVNTL